jgi:hypothetical protein
MTDEKDKSSKTGFSFTMKDGKIEIGDGSDARERAKAREAKKAERDAKKAEREAKRAAKKAEREAKRAERKSKN